MLGPQGISQLTRHRTPAPGYCSMESRRDNAGPLPPDDHEPAALRTGLHARSCLRRIDDPY